jgi:hypothetical protein
MMLIIATTTSVCVTSIIRTVAVSQTSTGLDQSCQYTQHSLSVTTETDHVKNNRGLHPSLNLDACRSQHGHYLCLPSDDAGASRGPIPPSVQGLYLWSLWQSILWVTVYRSPAPITGCISQSPDDAERGGNSGFRPGQWGVFSPKRTQECPHLRYHGDPTEYLSKPCLSVAVRLWV